MEEEHEEEQVEKKRRGLDPHKVVRWLAQTQEPRKRRRSVLYDGLAESSVSCHFSSYSSRSACLSCWFDFNILELSSCCQRYILPDGAELQNHSH